MPSKAPTNDSPPTKATKPRVLGKLPTWWPFMSEIDRPNTTIAKRACVPRMANVRAGDVVDIVTADDRRKEDVFAENELQ